jgi:hypothetical protein
MTDNERRYYEALTRIAELASAAAGGPPAAAGGPRALGCTVKSLPGHLRDKAARQAKEINPANAPLTQPLGGATAPPEPAHIALLTSRYWGPTARQLTVSFMESTESDLRTRIVSHLNAWSAGVSFVETGGVGEVRISRGPGGYYSYLGTDVSLIPQDQQTMNLEGFSMDHDESEFRRVVRHEAGHTLGFPHEHMRRQIVQRIDPERAYDYFWRTQGWPRPVVDQQVLTPLEESSIFGTPDADENSIMCYQLPGEITFDGQPIFGGVDVNATDLVFAAQIYPQGSFTPKRAEDALSRA